MQSDKTLAEVRKIFEGDRFATENGAVIEEIGERSAVCSLTITDSHRNAMGAVMGGVYFMLADFAFAVAANWEKMMALIKGANRPINVLNLFAYTGGATVACLSAGAKVTHVDASKGMVGAAKENAELSGLGDAPIRYIVDDCKKFIEREIRRGNKYDGIIMDPPSYGRGPGGEMWKIESDLYKFVELCSEVLSDNPLFVLINSYTTGLQPMVLQNVLKLTLKDFKGRVEAYEVGIATEEGITLPCGAGGIFINDGK